MAAHSERPGLSRFLHWPIYFRWCYRIPSLCFAGRSRWFWAENIRVRQRSRSSCLGHFADVLPGLKPEPRGSFASLFAEWHLDWDFRRSSAGQVNDNESGLRTVCSGQVAGKTEPYSELWTAMGSPNISQACDSAVANGLRIALEQSTFSI